MPDGLPVFGRRRVPIFPQQARSECGIACLAMVAGYHGRRTALRELRALASGNRGQTLSGLIELAGRVGLIGRPLRVSVAELERLRLPAILHWRMNHFVVLVRTTRQRVHIHDPGAGRRALSWKDLDRRFSGVALELSPRQDFTASSEPRPGLLSFVAGIRDVRRYLFLILLITVVAQLLSVVPPIATQILVDEVVTGQDRAWFPAALAGLGAIMIVAVVLEAFRAWTTLFTGTRLASDMTRSVVAHLVTLPVTFVEQRHLGDIVSKLGSLVPIRQALTEDAVAAVVHLLVLVTTLAVMLRYSVPLTVVAVAFTVAVLLLFAVLLPRSRRLSAEGLLHRAEEQSSLLGTLRGFRTVRGLEIGVIRHQHWMRAFHRGLTTAASEGKLAIGRTVAAGVIAMMDQLAFLAVGIGGVLDHEVTVGVLVAFMSLRGRLAGALTGVTESMQRLTVLRVHVERLADLTTASPEPDTGTLTTTIRGRLQLRDLSFSYPAGPPLLSGLSLQIPEGQHVVITGPSGCGKTTLLWLLSGQLTPDAGDVLVDDIDLPLYDRTAFRRQIGIVSQSDHLFEGTIAENIAAFDPSPDLARIRAAATIACVWRDIRRLPMHVNTAIGDTGLALSGGQVQRLVLARALYRQPRILLLDEATSHLDVGTEAAVLQNLRAMSRTIVSVAHRPAAIAGAVRVVRLGEVAS